MAIKIRIKKAHLDLSKAVENNDFEAAQQIIASGLDLSEPWSGDSCYPLNCAIDDNNLPMVRLLIDNGMPIYNNSAENYRLLGSKEEVQHQHLYAWDWEPENAEAILLVLDYAKDVNSKDFSFNGFMQLVELKDSYTSELTDRYLALLLAKGGDVNLKGFGGKYLLEYFAIGKNKKYAPLLIAMCDDALLEIAPKKEPWNTPLFNSVATPYYWNVEALLKKGAKVDKYIPVAQSSLLDEAIDYKKRNKFKNCNGELDKIINLLRDSGAKTYAEMLADGEIKKR